MNMQSERITFVGNKLRVPDQPVIPYIEGDGIGPDIWSAAVRVWDAAVQKAYDGKRKVGWLEILAGEKAYSKTGEWLPAESFNTIRQCRIAIKGPLSTPVGKGIRSLNVALRHELQLYACVRPSKYFQGLPSPVKQPEKVDMVVFRENMEDLYTGIEWESGTPEASKIISFVKEFANKAIPPDSGIGIKHISAGATKRLVRKALLYAIEHKKSSVTLVHKGNIMKFTDGAFRRWGYEVAKEEFPETVITEEDLFARHGGKAPDGMIVIRDRIADAMFQQVLLRPDEYSVIATPNLIGDYLSDALAAQVGGLGLAPSANIGDGHALFEPIHGTAPKYSGQDKVNPSALILAGCMMFEYLGWNEAAEIISRAIQKTILGKRVTYDLARQIPGAVELRCSQFGDAVIENL
ncbi:MAG: isocitrate dehydrogenase (NADP(+)) [Pseudomonadota bacterium]